MARCNSSFPPQAVGGNGWGPPSRCSLLQEERLLILVMLPRLGILPTRGFKRSLGSLWGSVAERLGTSHLSKCLSVWTQIRKQAYRSEETGSHGS